jgi:hypothetical protein
MCRNPIEGWLGPFAIYTLNLQFSSLPKAEVADKSFRMTTLRPFTANDLFKFNHINLDPLTETYSSQFYMVSTSAHSTQAWPSSTHPNVLISPHSNICPHGLGAAGRTRTRTGA